MSLFAIVLSVHVLIAALMIGLILIQHGKGADAGAAFGSGASGTVFGAKGSGSFMTRSTAVLATSFFITSLTLAYLGGNRTGPEDIVDKISEVPVIQPSELSPDDLINNISATPQLEESAETIKQADVPTPE
jgi:preprotein translocase subunit SecG